MGSSNKWRKILTILMIINLCFVLFSKITKSFGATVYTATIGNTNFDFSSEFVESTPYFALFAYNNNNNAIVLRSTEPFTYETRRNSYGAYINYFYGFVNGSTTNTYKMKCLNSQLSTVASFVSGTSFVDLTAVAGFGENATNTSTTLTPVFSNFDIYDFVTGDLIFGSTVDSTIYPFFDNKTEIENGYPNGVFISPGDYSIDDNLYFHLLSVNSETVSTGSNSIFYYTDKIFLLNENSEYYRTFEGSDDNSLYYYYIPKYDLSFNLDTSYVYVLSNSSESINNSNGHISEDDENGIFDVIESDTTGVMTSADLENDRLNKIENDNNKQTQNSNNIVNSLTDTTVQNSTIDSINSNLDFNNENTFLNALNFGFFSRLTSLISSVSYYNLNEVSEINIPLPFYEDGDIFDINPNLNIKSNFISSHLDSSHPEFGFDLKVIITSFWYFIFTFYVWRFVNKLYISIASGKILDNFSSSDEVITNNML